MKVIRPTNNKLTRGYSTGHPGYDFAGLNLPDEVRAGSSGVIVQRVDLYNSNWINNGTLTTKDYGNYIKIKHDDGTFELHAHLKKGSSLNVGTRVSAGQVIARIGNSGNSSGNHLHFELRNAKNINVEAEFITNSQIPMDTVTIEKKDHEKLVRGMAVLVQVGNYLGVANPDLADYKDYEKVLAGKEGYKNQLEKAVNAKDAEIKNREEQVGRLEGDLINKDKLIIELQDSHKPYLERIKFLEGEVDTISKKLGATNIALAECKSQSPVNDLSVADVLILLFNKLRGVKLK